MSNLRFAREFLALRANIKKADVKGLQERRLRAMLRWAWERSAWYRRTFEQAGITEQALATAPLAAFPTMDKAALTAHFDELITVTDVMQDELRRFDADPTNRGKRFKERYHLIHSSGSTGKPWYFLYDEAAWSTVLAGIVRGALWGMSGGEIAKLLWERPRIAYLAATDGRYGGAMAVGDGIDGVGGSKLFVDVNTPLAQITERIQAFRPNLIIGYPSAIRVLAEPMTQSALRPQLKRVVSCGEPLNASVRRCLEQAFECPVINFYGASESLALGVEGEPSQGMALFDDLNVLEIGQDGVYLTCLYNRVQPLIRYRLSDRLRPRTSVASLPFSVIESVQGRDEDLLWFTDASDRKEFLHPLSIEGFCLPGLVDYQFRSTGARSFEMLAQTEHSADRAMLQRELTRQMRGILHAKGLDFVAFSVSFTDEIKPDPHTGKKRLIINAL